VEETKPWKLYKKNEKEKLSAVLWTLCETLRIVAVHVYPFMPETAEKLWEKLGFEKSLKNFSQSGSGIKNLSTEWGFLEAGNRVKKGDNLFNRIENAEK